MKLLCLFDREMDADETGDCDEKSSMLTRIMFMMMLMMSIVYVRPAGSGKRMEEERSELRLQVTIRLTSMRRL